MARGYGGDWPGRDRKDTKIRIRKMNAYIFARDVFVHVLCWKTHGASRNPRLSGASSSSLKKLKTLDAMSEGTFLRTHMQTHMQIQLFPREALFAECAETIARGVSTLRFIGMAYRTQIHTHTHTTVKNQQRRYSRRLKSSKASYSCDHSAVSLYRMYV